MINTVELPWGESTLRLRLPDRWTVLGTLRPTALDPAADVAASCREALAQPIGTTPLGDRMLAHSRVLVVVDDHTRPTPVSSFLPVVLERLVAAGARAENISILLANGVHRASTVNEVNQKLGAEIAARYRWGCHDAYDAANLVDVGATTRGTPVRLNRQLATADLIVCLGAVEPHLLLGFGGGLKLLVPGCAAAATIGKNHLQGVDSRRFDLVGARAEDSPMRLDLEEAAQLLGKEIFLVNVALDAGGAPVRFFCGDPVAAHRAGTAFVDEHARLPVDRPADVVIANSHPLDADLRQSLKCVGNALFAARPGGTLVGCVRCVNGLGELPIPRRTLPYPLLRALVRAIGRRRILPLVERVKRGEPVEEVFLGNFGLQMLRRNNLALYSEQLPRDTGRKLGMVTTFDDLERLLRWTARRVPRRATVWVFPDGGASYAALTAGSAPR